MAKPPDAHRPENGCSIPFPSLTGGGFSWANVLRKSRPVAAIAAVLVLLFSSGEHGLAFGQTNRELPEGSGDLELLSIGPELASFEQVFAAVEAERLRLAGLEARLEALETIPLPAADPAQPAGDKGPKKDATKPPKTSDAKGAAAGPYEVGSDTDLRTSWEKSGGAAFTAESARKDFRVKIGGRSQFDASAFSAGPGPSQPPNQGGLDPSLADAVNVRRARLRIEGRMYELYDWVCEYDFANQINVRNATFPTEGDVGPLTSVTDLWMQLREIPLLGTVRVGNQKDPFGYEHLTSSRWLNFMERSFCQDAFEGPFNGGFLPGIQMLNTAYDGRLAWQVGEFKNVTNPFGFSNFDGGSQTVGRLVVLPVYEDEGRKLLHMAVSGRTMGLRDGQVRFRSRGEIRNGPSGPLNPIYADAGVLLGSWQNMLGLELVGNNGPWSFQSEYFGSWLYNGVTTNKGPYVTNGLQPPPGTPVGTVYYQGGYAEVLYFLTGESRTYSLIESRFDRPIPRNNFYALRDPNRRFRWRLSEGAWQVGVWYSHLNLDDGQVNGGVLNSMTLGINWMINPNARVYLNYDFTYRDFVNVNNVNGSGCINGFGTRLAFDF